MNAYEDFPYKVELERRVFTYLAPEKEKDQGTYLQAMVMSVGDELQAKVKYFELRFRQMAEAGLFVPFMSDILADKGMICYICREPEEILKKRLTIRIGSPVTWAHAKCLEKLRGKDYRTTYQLFPLSEDFCPICFCRPYDPKYMIYLGRELSVCSGHVAVSESFGDRLCYVCDESYSFWNESRHKSTILKLSFADIFSEYSAHVECIEKIKSILKEKSIQQGDQKLDI